jgi:hypothetical protein
MLIRMSRSYKKSGRYTIKSNFLMIFLIHSIRNVLTCKFNVLSFIFKIFTNSPKSNDDMFYIEFNSMFSRVLFSKIDLSRTIYSASFMQPIILSKIKLNKRIDLVVVRVPMI